MTDSPMYDEMAQTKRSAIFAEMGPKMPSPMAMQKGGAPIGVALDQQSAEIASLTDEVHILLDKIRAVCGPENPMPMDPGMSMDTVANSDVATRINDNSASLSSLRRIVKSVRERVEL